MKNESILQKIWQTRSFLPQNLKTTDDEPIEIIDFGTLNHSNGPDFINAKIKISNNIHSGDIEIHYQSSLWNKHQHQYDPRYNQVILHVVWNHDKEIFTQNNTRVNTLVLKNRVTASLLHHTISTPELPICSNQINSVKADIVAQQLSYAQKQRIELKIETIQHIHQILGSDWWKTWFWLHLKSFLGPMNETAALQLTERVNKRYILSCTSVDDLTAYLFGISGWIKGALAEKSQDEYSLLLQQKFDFFRFKHEWESPFVIQWNYKQVRPPSFPEIRMAQFANWFFLSEMSFDFLTEPQCFQWKSEISKFQQPLNTYWENHYQLGKPSRYHVSTIGQNTISQIATNSWYYGLIAYSKSNTSNKYLISANSVLTNLPIENNRYIKWMNQLFEKCKNNHETQALMAQYKLYCSKKACSQCLIGQEILNGALMKYQKP